MLDRLQYHQILLSIFSLRWHYWANMNSPATSNVGAPPCGRPKCKGRHRGLPLRRGIFFRRDNSWIVSTTQVQSTRQGHMIEIKMLTAQQVAGKLGISKQTLLRYEKKKIFEDNARKLLRLPVWEYCQNIWPVSRGRTTLVDSSRWSCNSGPWEETKGGLRKRC